MEATHPKQTTATARKNCMILSRFGSQIWKAFWFLSLLAAKHKNLQKSCPDSVQCILKSNSCCGSCEIALLPQFLRFEPHFVRKGCCGSCEIALLPQFLRIEPYFVRSVAAEIVKSKFYLSFCTSNLISCEGVAAVTLNPVFAHQTAFRAKGLPRTIGNRNFSAVFAHRTSFRVKKCTFRDASSALPAA
eukprot:s2_g76.t1